MLLIDSSKLRILQQQQSSMGDLPLDTAQVETQVEILRSENIGLAVIRDLHLSDDPEFSSKKGGIFGFAASLLASGETKSEAEINRDILQKFLQNRSISRVGRTYVLDIGFTSLDPNHAATIANAIADTYIVDQLEAKYEATRRASVWLQERIRELRSQASVADRAVLEYKERNSIVDFGAGTNAGPRLLGEQQLGELNTQLSQARAATTEAKARLERINETMKRDVPDASVADSLKNEVITRLRNQYLDIAAKEAIWSARYGADHLAAVNLRTQMSEIRRSIADEIKRIAESYKSDYEIAKAREINVEKDLAKLVISTQGTNRERLGLRDLESTAQVYQSIYNSFLQRYMEAIQQQSFPITEARVISAAAAPTRKSSPVTLNVLGLATALGCILSFIVAALREAIDRVFRTTRQVEAVLMTNCLAVLPRLGAEAFKEPSQSEKRLSLPTKRTGKPDLRAVGSLDASQTLQFEARIAKTHAPLMRYVVNEPLSSFAEAFRAVKVAADVSGSMEGNKVIGIASVLPREGKSTVSSNLAQLIAHSGKKAILIDGDLRNPSLTRALAPTAKVGLLEVLSQKINLADAVQQDPETGLVFLPSVIESRIAHTNEILASASFRDLIAQLRKLYDFIVIDFPPLAPVVDVRTTTRIVDNYILVVEWGKTRMNLVQSQLASVPDVREKLLGVILNKVNVTVLERYEQYYGRYYYKRYYGRYGYGA